MDVKRILESGSRSAAKIAVVALVLIATLAAAPTASASPPGAGTFDAHGCTSAAGGGQQCITVIGTGVHVDSVQNIHDLGPTIIKCQIHSTDLFTQGGTPGWVENYNPGCLNGSVAWVWNANQNFDSGSTMCASSKDSWTGGVYTNPACETIG